MIFIGEKGHYESLARKSELSFYDAAYLKNAWDEIHARLKAGEGMIYASVKNLDLLQKLWIFSYKGELTPNATVKPLPQGFRNARFNGAAAQYLYVRCPGTYSMHGVDEELRADVYPLLVDCDTYGREKGAVGLWLRHYDAALTSGSYLGGNWYIFALEDPASAAPVSVWNDLVGKALDYAKDGCFISRLTPEFPLYRRGERVRVDYRLENTGNQLQAASLVIEAFTAKGRKIADVGIHELALNPNGPTLGYMDWYPKSLNGVYTLRATLRLHDRFQYGLTRENTFAKVDELSSAVMFRSGNKVRPTVEVQGKDIIINGKKDFYMGTHYYPSSTFFELSYRQVRLERAVDTIAAMRRAGIKICRLWCDPVLDELSLRGMESLIELLADNGIVAWITMFTSWVHYMEVNTAKRRARFEAADMKDETLIGLIMHNMREQRMYVAEMAERWKGFTNVVWDFSNEFSVVDPQPDQLNEDWIDDSYKSLKPPYQSINLFNQWANQIKDEIRLNGAEQPVVFGVSCWNTGSENYRCTRNADIVVDHTYYPKEHARLYTNYQNANCAERPYIVEEFGGTWMDNDQRAGEFDARFHGFLATGADAAMSYEWGTSWLCDRMSGTPPYMKFTNGATEAEWGRFLYKGRYDYAASWPEGCFSVCPWIASHMYSINYDNVNYESPTIMVTKRTAQLGEGLGGAPVAENAYLILPFETEEFAPSLGYARKFDRINACFNALWSAGARFRTWQADCLDAIPSTAKIAIYPNNDPIAEPILAGLKALEKAGAKLYLGDDLSFVEDANLVKVAFAPAENAQLQFRPTHKGTVYSLHSDDPAPRVFTVEDVTLAVAENGFFLKGAKGVTMAETVGELKIGGKLVASVEAKTVFTADEALNVAKTVTALPYGPGKITLPGFKTCKLINDDGEQVDVLTLIDGALDVPAELVTYRFVFEK